VRITGDRKDKGEQGSMSMCFWGHSLDPGDPTFTGRTNERAKNTTVLVLMQ
jgi:hypothetical protein